MVYGPAVNIINILSIRIKSVCGHCMCFYMQSARIGAAYSATTVIYYCKMCHTLTPTVI